MRRTFQACCALLLAAAFATPSASAESGLPPTWQRGANLASWWHDEWENGSTDASLDALRDTGSTDAAFVATWYMASPTDSGVAPDADKTPSDAGLLRAMAAARARGLRVVVKPHVDVADGSFRGSIAPADRAAWFASYATMLDHYADLAQQAGASMLVVGTELTSMSSDTAAWRALIAGVRSRFSGRLTFAANQLDGARAVGFWDALDYIGIDAYMPLADAGLDPSVDDLAAAWHRRGYLDGIGALHATWGKPVLFTEVGYQSRAGTAATPWWATGPVSAEAQRRAYEAAYRVWSVVPWFEGFYWWDWSPAGFDPGDGAFNPRGKPAEQTVRAWNSAPYAPPGSTPPPSPTGPGPAAKPRGLVRLRARVHGRRHARRRQLRLSGRLTPRCARSLVVEVEAARGHRWRRSLRRRIRVGEHGGFHARLRVRPGRYRARALACAQARSRRAYVRA
jgi:hypothetical protein